MRFSKILFAIFVACGGEQKTTDVPRPPASATSTTSTAVDAGGAQAPPAAPADPTVLTDDQKKRDDALTPKASAIVDAYSNVGAELSKDKKKVFFRSTRDGQWQAYAADVAKPTEAPKKLTSGAERVMSIRPTYDGKYLLFTSDHGADEDFQIFRMGMDGSNVTNLTPNGALHREPPLLARNRTLLMAYSAMDKKDSKTQVFTQSTESGDPKVVYTDPSPGGLADLSPDGTRALFFRVVSLSEQILFEIDLDTGAAKRLYPAEGKTVKVNDAAYSGDARKVFVATDDGGESSFVVALEPSSRVVSGRYKEEVVPTGFVDGVSPAPTGDMIAITVDAGDHTEVRILDGKTMRLDNTVKAPLGVLHAGRFAQDGSSFVMTTNTADQPSNIALVDLKGAIKPLRTEARPGLAQLPAIDASLTKIPTFDALQIPENLYLPRGNRAKLPTIVLVHGGPAGSSKIGWNVFARFYTSQGYAVVEPNIRGSTGFGRAYEMADNRDKRGDALKDLESVNKWAKSQAWCDPARVIVMGASYGGYMTLMALTRQPDLWRAGVDLVGIANLKTFLRSTAQAIRSVFVQEFGDLDADAEMLDNWSPSKRFDKIKAPLFVYQGANDPRVPRPESDLIVNTLRAKTIPVEYMLADNEGHSMDRRENKVSFLVRTARFLADNAGPVAATAPTPSAAPSASAAPKPTAAASASAAPSPSAASSAKPK
jgi:dipeptidyl aminopeptidase/acylaminoacyl peptidase